MSDSDYKELSDEEFKKESKKQVGKKLKRINPKFDKIQDDIIDIYEGKKKTTDPAIKDKKSAMKYMKGRGKGKGEAFEEHFGPGSLERVLGGRSTKIPKNMRGGGVALRGFGRANYSKKDI
jgi:hypothetical protein